MSYSDFILIHWRKERQVFSKNLAILRQQPDKNAVHDLRVAIKKLRSCLKLYLLVIERREWKELFFNTKKLFNILGKQRDIEMNIELLTEYEKETNCQYPKLQKFLKSLLQNTYRWTEQALKSYKKDELEKITSLLIQDTDLSAKEELLQKTTEIINSHLLEIKHLLKQPHEVRIRLKEVFYWLKLLPPDSLTDSSLEKELHSILNDFGVWQDNEMLLIKVKHFRKDSLPKSFPEYQSLKILGKKIIEKNKELLKVVLHKTRRHLTEISLAPKVISEA